MIRCWFVRLAGAAVLIAWCGGAAAQTTTATIEGTIVDTTGGLLPGVSVEVTGTTITRSVETDAAGFYRAVALPPGPYTVTAALAGFRTKVTETIDMPLNHTAVVDLTMEPAGQAETVIVRAAPPVADPTDSSVTTVIDARTIEAIPLNGRNYLDLILLTPGVTVNQNARSDLGGRDTRGAIMGERAGNTAFLIDGHENSDDFRGGVFQDYTQDAIQEFEVIDAGYKAEFGRGSGGIVNVITKSGSNAVTGSGFFFLRNDALDASTVDGEEAPELERYNWGVTLGGPVTRDRAWYFGSFEQITETREAIFAPNIPDILREGEDFSRQPETDNYRLFAKYSRALAEGRHDLRAEGSWSRLERRNELSGPAALPSASDNSDTNTLLTSATLTSIFGSRALLETSAGYRDQGFDLNQGLGDGSSYSISLEGSSFVFGPRFANQLALDQKYFTAREVLSLFPGGQHVAKIGAEYVHTAVDGVNGPSLVNVLVSTRANFARFGRDSFQIPQGVGFINPGDELTRLRNDGIGVFAQDDWRLLRNLTLNLGVRYDYDSKFGDGDNIAPRLGVVWSPDAATTVRASWGLFYDRYRLGLAQVVPELGGANGRIVVELNYPRLIADALPIAGGLARMAPTDPFFLHRQFGIPEDAVLTRDNVQALTGLTPDQFLARLRTIMAGFPIALAAVDFSPSTGFLRQDLAAALQDVIRIARPYGTPYNNTFTAGVQRTFMDLVGGVTYVHRLIQHVSGVRLTNLSPESRVRGTAITTDGGALQRTYSGWYDGDYDALVFSVDKRFNERYQARANYTWARGEDNLLNPNLGIGVATQGGGAVPTDNLDLEFDRGPSDLVVPHTFVLSGVAALPFDLWVSGVYRATSGVRFSAAGTTRDYDGDGIFSSRPVGTRRNEFTGPASHNVDLRIEKRLTFGRRYTAAALVEFFNLTNARNPRLIDNAWVDNAPGPNFGDIRVPLPGRETQIGFRLIF
jgi:outer membrane receptor for ferrienterochelin and colicin